MESVRSRRERLGITQKELAEGCGCHVTTISQIERGCMQPSLELFAKLARQLKMSPKRLLNELLHMHSAPRPIASVTELHKERERRERRN